MYYIRGTNGGELGERSKALPPLERAPGTCQAEEAGYADGLRLVIDAPMDINDRLFELLFYSTDYLIELRHDMVNFVLGNA